MEVTTANVSRSSWERCMYIKDLQKLGEIRWCITNETQMVDLCWVTSFELPGALDGYSSPLRHIERFIIHFPL